MKTCKYCGNEITGTGKVYCSRACRNRANPRQAKETAKLEKVCEVCGKTFMAKRRDRLYCSKNCNWKARQLRKPRGEQPDQTFWRKHRGEVLEGQKGLCWLCQEPITEGIYDVHHLQGDHDPRSDDVVALHKSCHSLFHKVTLVIQNGNIEFQTPILGQVQDRIREKENNK